jgi:hypothetical protein
MVSYLKWCKRFRKYTDKGIDPQTAWKKTNNDYGMNIMDDIDECRVDADGCLIDNDGDAETNME